MSLSSAGFWNQEREVTESVIVMPKILLLYVEKLALRFRSPFHVLYGKVQSNAGDSFFLKKNSNVEYDACSNVEFNNVSEVAL
jgi:hypothetical protein